MMNKCRKNICFGWLLVLLSASLLGAILLGICLGSARLTFSQVIAGVFRKNPEDVYTQIIWVVRLPQVAACLLAGAALSVSGVLLQTATNNPLAGPNVIGVNAGAGFAMVMGMCFAPMAYRWLPVMAFAGAFACTLLIVFTANRVGGSKVSIVLAGVAVSALLNAGISLLKLLYPDLAVAYHTFSVGGVSGVAFEELAVPGLIIGAVLVFSTCLSARLNLLCLGDGVARNLGVRVRLLRTITLLLASAAAAAAVCFAGLLGFVGLMVPHIARTLTGSADVRKLIPICGIMGAILVTLADLLGRVLFAPSEIPAGIITAIIGAPFFFALLMERRNRV